ncbi:DUF2142 domain-containing protein [Ruminococcaceae bacterium OttesenSCG-928-D13]|nr:DUF2142 domain-containing protein [Ruminococcaceae bacterium OttesenSCG-928-D13]
MEKTLKNPPENGRKLLPAWAKWLIGWAAVLVFAVGLTYYWRVVFSLKALPAAPFTLGVMGVFSLLYAAVFLICRLKGDTLCLRAALCVFLLGLLFCFATAPLQVPDESRYFLRAQAISQGGIVPAAEIDFPDEVDLLVQHFMPPEQGPLNFRVTYQNGELAPAAFANYLAALDAGEAPAVQAEAPLFYPFLPLLGQALFIAAARLFGFSALGQLYAARLCNLLCYTVLCYFAFRNAKRYRGVFFAVGLLPLCLFMAASCSTDALMLGLCFFAASVVLRDEVRLRDVILFAVALAVANYIKPLNFLLVFLLLMVPKKRWRLKLKRWVVVAICIAAVVVFQQLWGELLDRQLSYLGGWAGYNDLPRGSGDAADTGSQLLFVLQNPLRFIAVTVQSIYEADGFLFDLGHLGHMDMTIPLVGGLSVALLVLASALAVRPKEDTRQSALWVLGAVALVYCAAVLAGMYITDTDYQSIRITGQQPRYFLPAFLLAFVLLAAVLGKLLRPRKEETGLNPPAATLKAEQLTMWLAAGVGLVAAVLLFQNYFIGQWIPKTAGGWKLVNMLGWVQQ